MTSTAADTFARFLDVLAGSLDDHDADGAALAAQLHLSRFHCDRLVSAAAGEPPAALRRRVLLERAAYRLITTDHDVLRVAVEAGYSSNEAFTRAFARAFGLAPSRWRARPTSYRLDAPSEVHFTPPGACGSPRTGRSLPWTCYPDGRPPRLAGRPARRRVRPAHARAAGRPRRDLGRRHRRRPDRPLVARAARRADGDVGRRHREPALRHRRRARRDPRRHPGEAGRGRPGVPAKVHGIIDDGRLDETFVDATCTPARCSRTAA